MISQTRANKILPNQSVLSALIFLVALSLARTEPAVSQEEEIEDENLELLYERYDEEDENMVSGNKRKRKHNSTYNDFY